MKRTEFYDGMLVILLGVLGLVVAGLAVTIPEIRNILIWL